MFDFQKLEVYKKAKVFHLDCKSLIVKVKPDSYVKDQLGRARYEAGLFKQILRSSAFVFAQIHL